MNLAVAHLALERTAIAMNFTRTILEALHDTAVAMGGMDGRGDRDLQWKYHVSEDDLVFRAALGKRLAVARKSPETVKVLYIGSGQGTYFDSLVRDDEQARGRFECVSVDPGCDTVLECARHLHLRASWEDVDPSDVGPHGHFDVMVLDVEPHGRERAIHDKFACRMTAPHLVVAKCIGFMDLYGSDLADRLLRHLAGKRVLRDYFEWGHCFDFRDVYCVIAEGPVDVHPHIHQCLGLGLGRIDWRGVPDGEGGHEDEYALTYAGYKGEPLETVFRKLRDHMAAAAGPVGRYPDARAERLRHLLALHA